LSGRGFLNSLTASLYITGFGTPLNVMLNAGLAYMLSKPVPGKSFFKKYVMFTMLFGAGMIPSFINIRNLGLINSWWASILPAACGAWTVMVMMSFFQSLSPDLEEAAKSTAAASCASSASSSCPCPRPCWRPSRCSPWSRTGTRTFRRSCT
jgi:putative aldouronate transport system permease protein